MTESRPDATHLDLIQRVVSSYLSNNPVQGDELPLLVRNVCVALRDLHGGARQGAPEEKPEKLKPSQVRKSILPGGLVSFIDGKPYKILKRHLTKHGLDPDAYRKRFGLPMDYPMVAPSYAANRSALAIASRFGTKESRARKTPDRSLPRPPARPKAASGTAARMSAS